MSVRDALRQLVEGMPDDEAQMWVDAIKTRDPLLLTLLLAPEDDEEETDEERAAVEHAKG